MLAVPTNMVPANFWPFLGNLKKPNFFKACDKLNNFKASAAEKRGKEFDLSWIITLIFSQLFWDSKLGLGQRDMERERVRGRVRVCVCGAKER